MLQISKLQILRIYIYIYILVFLVNMIVLPLKIVKYHTDN